MQAVRPGLDIRYKIKIVEIKDNQSPETAMKTNPAWFEESNIMTNIFPYPVSAIEFADSGKYAWQIQSYGFSGNPLGENDGLSEIMSFMYIDKSIYPNSDVIAFPNDIDVLFPKVGEEIDADGITLQWSYKKESDSSLTYSIKIVEVLEGQSPQSAIRKNEAFWEWANILCTFLIFPETDLEFTPGKEYAWQVSVYEDNTKIDECKVSSLKISAKKESELDVLFPKVGEEIDADGLILEWKNYEVDEGSVRYSLKIVEVFSDQTPKTAIKNNESYFEKSDLEISQYMCYLNPSLSFEAGKKYAWCVTVYKGGEIIGESSVGSFIVKSDNE